MADYELFEDMVADLGKPDLIIDAANYKSASKRKHEDVCDQIAIYLNDEANGGCIAYGKYDWGWDANPSPRFALQVLTRIGIAAQPFAKAFESVREVCEPEPDHERFERMQAFLDRNQIAPSGTTSGDWRKLANECKDTNA